MILLSAIEFTLPITNPVLKFLVILLIILIAPIVLNKLKVPAILGLIIAGAVIGPYGINLLLRDSGIILSGTAGLLYIMFLAGLSIDLAEFKRNSSKSLLFGMYTFIIPMTLGTVTGIYVLNFSVISSVLLASMFASHTLIAYPIISKLGITKNRAVNISVGGTLITDILALMILAVIVGMTVGEVNSVFWTRLSISIIIFAFIIMLGFPIIARWFLKRYSDKVSQYIFVLAMVFFGAFLAEIAGIEAIIGAFLAGLALNRLISATSPLMNRVEFVGNAIFIPFFLIGVGMLIDYRAFFTNIETIKVAAVMTIVATMSKFIAAWLTQKSLGFSADERRIIFGLSNAQAAATLAAVMIGYNIITGYTDTGEPIRLLNESILNGSIIMILITCTIATFVAQKGAQNILLSESTAVDDLEKEYNERILIPINNPETIEELINLGAVIKSKENKTGFYALNIINNSAPGTDTLKNANNLLEKAAFTSSSTDMHLQGLLRYDYNIANGIASVIKEHGITDLILGLHVSTGISKSLLGNLTKGILSRCDVTTFVYKPAQPISTVKRHIIIVPAKAEEEAGFRLWLLKVLNIASNTGAKLHFYGTEHTIQLIKDINLKHPVNAEFQIFDNWNNFLILSRDIRIDDNIIIVLSRHKKPSYHPNMGNIHNYLNKNFQSNSFILVYPLQFGFDTNSIDLNNASLI